MRTMKSKVSLLIALAATLGLMSSPAMAGLSSGNYVTFMGQPMIAIEGNANGMSAEHRAWVAQDNFDNALANATNRSPDAVQVCRENGAYTVRLDGKYILSADGASAAAAGMTAKELAFAWAGAMKAKLADANATMAYVASLRDEHALKANVSITQNELLGGENAVNLPFRMAEGSLAADPAHPGQVLLVLDKSVQVQQGLLPEDTKLMGYLAKKPDGKPCVSFNSAQLPNGKTMVLRGVVAETYVNTAPPHLVCSQDIPANELTGVREPARVGIGAQAGSTAIVEQDVGEVAVTGPGAM